MHHRIGLKITQGIGKQLTIAQFADHQVTVQNGPAITGGEIVIDQHLIARFA